MDFEGGKMSQEHKPESTMKQKAIHEGKELLVLFLYLAFFFCALVTYKMLLLKAYEGTTVDYGLALINALVIAKVILIGDFVKAVHKFETKALFLSVLYKAFIYGVLVFAFHVLEEWVKQLIHGGDLAKAIQEVNVDQLAARCLIIVCTFIPLFAFRELRRVLGEEKFHALIFKAGEAGEL
jgi:hypothetical protein